MGVSIENSDYVDRIDHLRKNRRDDKISFDRAFARSDTKHEP